jgi:UDP-galactopyranose mutase
MSIEMKNRSLSILVVGAGISGAVVARVLAEYNYKVTVIDKRNHIAGNCFDYISENGIRVHKYGPHIFHTSNMKVVDWLSRFTEWVPYKHRVKGMLCDGRLATIPPNNETAKMVGIENIVDIFYRPYTKKMWGVELEELDKSIINRVPIRDDDNEYYFPNDAFQAMPKDGYTKMFENILDHCNITVTLEKSFNRENDERLYDHVFNSMPIDEYYDFIYGKLPYRSIKFENITLPVPYAMQVPTTNLTNDGPYTRVTEWKRYPGHGENTYETILTFEKPVPYEDNNFERYYPVKDISGINREKYKKYAEIPNNKCTFIGRCGLYAYIDMHQAVSNALSVSKKFAEEL